MRQLTVFLLTLMLCTTATAKLYKWVDADGNVSYSERKPPDVQAEEVKLRGVQPVSKDEAEARLSELKNAAETKRKDREFKSTTSSEQAERDKRIAENCETLRQNVRVLKSEKRVKNADGTFVKDEARAGRIKQTEKDIADKCK